jgi:hypothetical protein
MGGLWKVPLKNIWGKGIAILWIFFLVEIERIYTAKYISSHICTSITFAVQNLSPSFSKT